MNLRKDFPLLNKHYKDKQLIYFDNAATTQKPQVVIDAIANFYRNDNANIHRGVYELTEHATHLYEQSRERVATFIGADSKEIVFTCSTTESINLVASTWAAQHVKSGDEILISELEHHSNMLPWQRLADSNNAVLKYIPVYEDGTLQEHVLQELITSKTKLVALSHISNAIGTHNNIKKIIPMAHAVGAKVLIDAAQSVPHEPINVHELACDFLAFSGHKMLGPTGIGILYIKKELHDAMPPYQLGGGMVYQAGFYESSFLKVPYLLEAGTPAIAQAIGLSAAINYLRQHSFDDIACHEAALCVALIDGLSQMDRIRILGPVQALKERGHIVSFTVKDMHPHDVAAYLGSQGICVRAGHHCAQPLAQRLGIDASVRVSFYIYNTIDEVHYFLDALAQLID